MSSREKYFWQSVIGLFAAVYLAFSVSEASQRARVRHLFMAWVRSGLSMALPARADLMLPFVKSISYPLGVWGFIVLTYLVIVGASNAVNLDRRPRRSRSSCRSCWSAHRSARSLT